MSDPAPETHTQDTAENTKPVSTLVVDTNVFIKGLPVDHISSTFVTVPDVVHELRSRTAKDRFHDLELKHGVRLMQPDSESIQAVRNFAKKTGDFASLALADMKVVALAFMLEKQENGMKRLRLEPVGSQPNISDRTLLSSVKKELNDLPEDAPLDGPAKIAPLDEQTVSLEDQTVSLEDQTEDQSLEQQLEDLSLDSKDVESVLQSATNDEFEVGSDEEFPDEELKSDEESKDNNDNDEPENDDDDGGWEVAGPKAKRHVPHVDEFFNGGWITPKNVKQRQAADAMGMKEARASTGEHIGVACVTSDFAMQNVMLKMGIQLVTPDGVRVQQLRTWVLRCHACFALTGDMDRQFCASCGHATLRRCSVTTGADGRLQVHLKANYRNNLRGTVFSMPRSRGGRHTVRDVITREDERAYVNAMSHKKRVDAKANRGMGTNALDDPDYIPDLILGNALSHANGYGVATDARGMPMVTRNRRNPNIVRHTGNRKKKSHK
ncbi:20S-pre-rRNA D-site endonuclease nob1 [Coemansia sp. RSA 2618]|nr:20S-pre-rRNA D-site endonuclease nob1 [Coemansia sp. RSA 2618]